MVIQGKKGVPTTFLRLIMYFSVHNLRLNMFISD